VSASFDDGVTQRKNSVEECSARDRWRGDLA
jgi:hypothetical protein